MNMAGVGDVQAAGLEVAAAGLASHPSSGAYEPVAETTTHRSSSRQTAGSSVGRILLSSLMVREPLIPIKVPTYCAVPTRQEQLHGSSSWFLSLA
jgi:hypothetical protein